jgi:O-antigen/teichoic acid export membrane protein
VLAVFGQDILVVRSWGEYASVEAHGLALGAYKFGWTVVIGAAIVAGSLIFLLGTFNPYFAKPPLEAAAGAAFLSMQILLLFTAQTTRVVVNFLVSEINRELTWRFVLLPVVVIGLWTGLTPTAFYLAAAAGLALSVALQLRVVNRRFPVSIRTARAETRRREWSRRAVSMWSSAIAEAAAQYAEVLLLGILVSPAVAGLYFVAARIANVFAMMSTGLHSYTSTHASNLYFSGQRSALQALFRSVMTMALLIAAPLFALVTLFGVQFLDVFGHHYADGYWVLLVLSVGSFSTALAGPSNSLLLVTGHEKLYSRVLFAAFLVRVALIVIAAPRFGALGVAGAWTLVNGPVAIGLAIGTRRLTGIDPSVLSLLAPQRPIDYRT